MRSLVLAGLCAATLLSSSSFFGVDGGGVLPRATFALAAVRDACPVKATTVGNTFYPWSDAANRDGVVAVGCTFSGTASFVFGSAAAATRTAPYSLTVDGSTFSTGGYVSGLFVQGFANADDVTLYGPMHVNITNNRFAGTGTGTGRYGSFFSFILKPSPGSVFNILGNTFEASSLRVPLSDASTSGGLNVNGCGGISFAASTFASNINVRIEENNLLGFACPVDTQRNNAAILVGHETAGTSVSPGTIITIANNQLNADCTINTNCQTHTVFVNTLRMSQGSALHINDNYLGGNSGNRVQAGRLVFLAYNSAISPTTPALVSITRNTFKATLPVPLSSFGVNVAPTATYTYGEAASLIPSSEGGSFVIEDNAFEGFAVAARIQFPATNAATQLPHIVSFSRNSMTRAEMTALQLFNGFMTKAGSSVTVSDNHFVIGSDPWIQNALLNMTGGSMLNTALTIGGNVGESAFASSDPIASRLIMESVAGIAKDASNTYAITGNTFNGELVSFTSTTVNDAFVYGMYAAPAKFFDLCATKTNTVGNVLYYYSDAAQRVGMLSDRCTLGGYTLLYLGSYGNKVVSAANRAAPFELRVTGSKFTTGDVASGLWIQGFADSEDVSTGYGPMLITIKDNVFTQTTGLGFYWKFTPGTKIVIEGNTFANNVVRLPIRSTGTGITNLREGCGSIYVGFSALSPSSNIMIFNNDISNYACNMDTARDNGAIQLGDEGVHTPVGAGSVIVLKKNNLNARCIYSNTANCYTHTISANNLVMAQGSSLYIDDNVLAGGLGNRVQAGKLVFSKHNATLQNATVPAVVSISRNAFSTTVPRSRGVFVFPGSTYKFSEAGYTVPTSEGGSIAIEGNTFSGFEVAANLQFPATSTFVAHFPYVVSFSNNAITDGAADVMPAHGLMMNRTSITKLGSSVTIDGNTFAVSRSKMNGLFVVDQVTLLNAALNIENNVGVSPPPIPASGDIETRLLVVVEDGLVTDEVSTPTTVNNNTFDGVVVGASDAYFRGDVTATYYSPCPNRANIYSTDTLYYASPDIRDGVNVVGCSYSSFLRIFVGSVTNNVVPAITAPNPYVLNVRSGVFTGTGNYPGLFLQGFPSTEDVSTYGPMRINVIENQFRATATFGFLGKLTPKSVITIRGNTFTTSPVYMPSTIITTPNVAGCGALYFAPTSIGPNSVITIQGNSVPAYTCTVNAGRDNAAIQIGHEVTHTPVGNGTTITVRNNRVDSRCPLADLTRCFIHSVYVNNLQLAQGCLLDINNNALSGGLGSRIHAGKLIFSQYVSTDSSIPAMISVKNNVFSAVDEAGYGFYMAPTATYAVGNEAGYTIPTSEGGSIIIEDNTFANFDFAARIQFHATNTQPQFPHTISFARNNMTGPSFSTGLRIDDTFCVKAGSTITIDDNRFQLNSETQNAIAHFSGVLLTGTTLSIQRNIGVYAYLSPNAMASRLVMVGPSPLTRTDASNVVTIQSNVFDSTITVDEPHPLAFGTYTTPVSYFDPCPSHTSTYGNVQYYYANTNHRGGIRAKRCIFNGYTNFYLATYGNQVIPTATLGNPYYLNVKSTLFKGDTDLSGLWVQGVTTSEDVSTYGPIYLYVMNNTFAGTTAFGFVGRLTPGSIVILQENIFNMGSRRFPLTTIAALGNYGCGALYMGVTGFTERSFVYIANNDLSAVVCDIDATRDNGAIQLGHELSATPVGNGTTIIVSNNNIYSDCTAPVCYTHSVYMNNLQLSQGAVVSIQDNRIGGFAGNRIQAGKLIFKQYSASAPYAATASPARLSIKRNVFTTGSSKGLGVHMMASGTYKFNVAGYTVPTSEGGSLIIEDNTFTGFDQAAQVAFPAVNPTGTPSITAQFPYIISFSGNTLHSPPAGSGLLLRNTSIVKAGSTVDVSNNHFVLSTEVRNAMLYLDNVKARNTVITVDGNTGSLAAAAASHGFFAQAVDLSGVQSTVVGDVSPNGIDADGTVTMTISNNLFEGEATAGNLTRASVNPPLAFETITATFDPCADKSLTYGDVHYFYSRADIRGGVTSERCKFNGFTNFYLASYGGYVIAPDARAAPYHLTVTGSTFFTYHYYSGLWVQGWQPADNVAGYGPMLISITNNVFKKSNDGSWGTAFGFVGKLTAGSIVTIQGNVFEASINRLPPANTIYGALDVWACGAISFAASTISEKSTISITGNIIDNFVCNAVTNRDNGVIQIGHHSTMTPVGFGSTITVRNNSVAKLDCIGYCTPTTNHVHSLYMQNLMLAQGTRVRIHENTLGGSNGHRINMGRLVFAKLDPSNADEQRPVEVLIDHNTLSTSNGKGKGIYLVPTGPLPFSTEVPDNSEGGLIEIRDNNFYNFTVASNLQFPHINDLWPEAFTPTFSFHVIFNRNNLRSLAGGHGPIGLLFNASTMIYGPRSSILADFNYLELSTTYKNSLLMMDALLASNGTSVTVTNNYGWSDRDLSGVQRHGFAGADLGDASGHSVRPIGATRRFGAMSILPNPMGNGDGVAVVEDSVESIYAFHESAQQARRDAQMLEEENLALFGAKAMANSRSLSGPLNNAYMLESLQMPELDPALRDMAAPRSVPARAEAECASTDDGCGSLERHAFQAMANSSLVPLTSRLIYFVIPSGFMYDDSVNLTIHNNSFDGGLHMMNDIEDDYAAEWIDFGPIPYYNICPNGGNGYGNNWYYYYYAKYRIGVDGTNCRFNGYNIVVMGTYGGYVVSDKRSLYYVSVTNSVFEAAHTMSGLWIQGYMDTEKITNNYGPMNITVRDNVFKMSANKLFGAGFGFAGQLTAGSYIILSGNVFESYAIRGPQETVVNLGYLSCSAMYFAATRIPDRTFVTIDSNIIPNFKCAFNALRENAPITVGSERVRTPVGNGTIIHVRNNSVSADCEYAYFKNTHAILIQNIQLAQNAEFHIWNNNITHTTGNAIQAGRFIFSQVNPTYGSTTLGAPLRPGLLSIRNNIFTTTSGVAIGLFVMPLHAHYFWEPNYILPSSDGGKIAVEGNTYNNYTLGAKLQIPHAKLFAPFVTPYFPFDISFSYNRMQVAIGTGLWMEACEIGANNSRISFVGNTMHLSRVVSNAFVTLDGFSVTGSMTVTISNNTGIAPSDNSASGVILSRLLNVGNRGFTYSATTQLVAKNNTFAAEDIASTDFYREAVFGWTDAGDSIYCYQCTCRAGAGLSATYDNQCGGGSGVGGVGYVACSLNHPNGRLRSKC